MMVTMLVLTTVLTVTMGVAALLIPDIIRARVQSRSTKAFFAAETGSERMLWSLRQGSPVFNLASCDSANRYANLSTGVCVSSIVSYPLEDINSTYYIEVASTSPVIFKSFGMSRNTTVRVIEITF